MASVRSGRASGGEERGRRGGGGERGEEGERREEEKMEWEG